MTTYNKDAVETHNYLEPVTIESVTAEMEEYMVHKRLFGSTYQQIADEMGLGVATIKRRLAGVDIAKQYPEQVQAAHERAVSMGIGTKLGINYMHVEYVRACLRRGLKPDKVAETTGMSLKKVTRISDMSK